MWLAVSFRIFFYLVVGLVLLTKLIPSAARLLLPPLSGLSSCPASETPPKLHCDRSRSELLPPIPQDFRVSVETEPERLSSPLSGPGATSHSATALRGGDLRFVERVSPGMDASGACIPGADCRRLVSAMSNDGP
jgi:hypothetical protein